MDNADISYRGVKEGKGLGMPSQSSATYHDSKFEAKLKTRWVRLATVVLYVVFVSVSAVALAIYYGMFWEPQPHLMLRNNTIPITTDVGSTITDNNNIKKG